MNWKLDVKRVAREPGEKPYLFAVIDTQDKYISITSNDEKLYRKATEIIDEILKSLPAE